MFQKCNGHVGEMTEWIVDHVTVLPAIFSGFSTPYQFRLWTVPPYHLIWLKIVIEQLHWHILQRPDGTLPSDMAHDSD